MTYKISVLPTSVFDLYFVFLLVQWTFQEGDDEINLHRVYQISIVFEIFFEYADVQNLKLYRFVFLKLRITTKIKDLYSRSIIYG